MNIPVYGPHDLSISEGELITLRKLADLERANRDAESMGFVKAAEMRSIIQFQIKDALTALDQIRVTKEQVGVLIGRFQTPMLHAGHKYLIESAINRHESCLVLIGVAAKIDRNNPLPYIFRRDLLQEDYPSVSVLPVHDTDSDVSWSANVDAAIAAAYPGSTARLYGGRNSFIPKYDGKFPTTELPTLPVASGTQVREMLKKVDKSSPEFRAGIIHATLNMEDKK